LVAFFTHSLIVSEDLIKFILNGLLHLFFAWLTCKLIRQETAVFWNLEVLQVLRLKLFVSAKVEQLCPLDSWLADSSRS
jgi:hypothetical protein